MFASSGLMTPPWGVPIVVGLILVLHHTCCEKSFDKVQDISVSHFLGDCLDDQLVRDVIEESGDVCIQNCAVSGLVMFQHSSDRRVAVSLWTKPKGTVRETMAQRSVPEVGTTSCATRSLTAGMPNGRNFLPEESFGIHTRRSGLGTNVPFVFKSRMSAVRSFSRFPSNMSMLTLSIPWWPLGSV